MKSDKINKKIKDDKINAEMSSRLRELRKDELHMTQEQFAESIGISRPNLTNIEVGNVSLTDRTIKTICSIHNVSENWLRTGEGSKLLNSDDEFDILIGRLYAEDDPFKKDVIKTMLSLSDDEWKFLAGFFSKMQKIRD